MTTPAHRRGESEEWNWARTHCFSASALHRPTTTHELQRIIDAAAAGGATLRCVGSRHSFTDIADADGLLDLSAMPEQFEIDERAATVTVNASMTYARLAELLEPVGLAIANMASLPHVSIGGAIATATHGSGDANANLATAVRSMRVATSLGETRSLLSDDPRWPAAPISLGAIGAVVALELATEPAFQVEQLVHDDVSWSRLTSSFDVVFGSAYSASVFTDWQNRVQLWTKRRTDEPPIDHATVHGGTLAATPQHPVVGADAQACTLQGPAGLWSQRLPHFKADAVPSVGAEVQSEFFVDRVHAAHAIELLRSMGGELEGILMASEIRTVCADDLWLSPQYQRDCVGFHFTWHHDPERAAHAAWQVAEVLSPVDPLPHWGKVFDPQQFDFAALYPRLGEALAVYESFDPSGVFTNAWMRRNIL